MSALGAARSPGAAPSPMVRRRLTVGGVAGLVGAAAYSSFLLAWPLGSTLDPVNSYVSELGVRTQPASAFFRASDVLAGLLIVLLALLLRDGLPSHWRREAGRAALAIAGAASVFDGWHPMGCLPSIAVACRPNRDVIGSSPSSARCIPCPASSVSSRPSRACCCSAACSARSHSGTTSARSASWPPWC